MFDNEKYFLMYAFKFREYGAGLNAIHMERTYPDFFVAHNIKCGVPNGKRIWELHNPFFYGCGLIDRIKNKDVICVRRQYANIIPEQLRATNGYSYYKTSGLLYSRFFPDIYKTNYSISKNPSIGYYVRNQRRESNFAFLGLVESLPNDFSIVTMGTKETIEPYLQKNKNWKHTYNPFEFFSSCSHFFYYRCSDFVDPLPHSLMEAIQSGHRIISPKSPKRTFVDGIDDLLSCVEFDECYNESKRGNKNNILNTDLVYNLTYRVVYSDFCFTPRLSDKRDFYAWLCQFV